MLGIFIFIVFLCLVIALSMIYQDMGKKSKIWEMWKIPPAERKAQFLFCMANIVIVGPFMFLLWPIILLGASRSLHSLLILLWVCLVLVFSIISLLRPRFTSFVFVFYFLISLNIYFDFTNRNATFPKYVDICNELRRDPFCIENDKEFNCSSQSKRGFFTSNKEICINKTNRNNDYNFKEYKSPFIGRVIQTAEPFLIFKNLPRNNCRNRICGYKYEAFINELHNHCSNCLERDEITTKLKISYLPQGSTLKVVDSFRITSNNWSRLDEDKIIVLEDEGGHKLELRERELDLFLTGSINQPGKKGDIIREDLIEIGKNSSFKKKVCFSNYEHKSEASMIEHLKTFIQTFQLENEMYFSNSSTNKDRDKEFCSDLSFKTESAYLLSHYYFETFDLNNKD